MTDRQAAKKVVLDYMSELEQAGDAAVAAVIEAHAASDYRFRGVHPFNELHGASATADTVWRPLNAAFRACQRRQDVFMAGPNRVDDSMWVMSMGKFMGLFDEPWLGIPPTGKLALLPYCEFHRIDNGRIAETALWIDIVSVMQQAGWDPLPMQTGARMINPGPRTQDGLLFEAQDDSESSKTLDLIMRMCSDLVDKDGFQSSNSSLAETWHDDMLWFGPAGIGSTYTILRYQLQHQGPFRAGLKDIDFDGHVLENAEGSYGAWFGWPNMRMKSRGGFMGLPASDHTTEMRVVDVYRRDGDRLAENWIFIDMLHYLKLLGVDVLDRCRNIGRH